jgi:hypothetical protein
MNPGEYNSVIGGKRYDTKTATLIADDCFWDGHNWERRGRNTFLYRTPKGNYFVVHQTCWQGERDSLEPLSIQEAIELWEGPCCEHECSFEKAFPGVTVEDA